MGKKTFGAQTICQKSPDTAQEKKKRFFTKKSEKTSDTFGYIWIHSFPTYLNVSNVVLDDSYTKTHGFVFQDFCPKNYRIHLDTFGYIHFFWIHSKISRYIQNHQIHSNSAIFISERTKSFLYLKNK